VSRFRELILATGVFAVLSIILTWPQALHPSHIPDYVDAYFNLWRLSWIAHQLFLAPRHLFDANIFFPHHDTLAFSDAVLLEGFVAAPLIKAGIPVVYVYNQLVLGSFAGCAVAMYALARTLTRRRMPAMLAGTIYAFAAFRFDHYFHLELLWAMWMPLAMLAVHRAITTRRWRDGIAAGLLITLQTYSSLYYAIFFATALVPFGLVMLAAGSITRRTAAVLAAGAALAALLVVPYVFPYLAARHDVGERSEQKSAWYSAGPRHYLAAMPGNFVWGRLTSDLGRPEKRLFAGALALGLVLVALWPPLDRTRVAYAAVLVTGVVLSGGPPGVVFHWLRRLVPVYRGLRAPARAAQIFLLAVSVLAAIGADRVLRTIATRWSPRRARYVGVLMIAVAILESAVRMQPLVPAERTPAQLTDWLRNAPAGVVADFPMPVPSQVPLHEAVFAYSSTFHWHPLVNGYSGNHPASYLRLLRDVDDFPSPAALQALRAAGVTYVVVHGRYYDAGRFAQITAALEQSDEVDESARVPESGSDVRVYTFTRP
jgi:hypothetical protein